MGTPHDKLFRQVFAHPEHARPLLRSILPPALVRAIDWTQLVRRRRSFVDAASREHHVDLLFSAPIAGRELLMYLLLEHKSSSERFTALQLLSNVVAIWQDYLRRHKGITELPPVIPIVIHHDDRGFTAPRSVRSLVALDCLPRSVARALAPLQPEFHFLLDDLATTSEADIQARALSTMARLTLLFMQHIRHQPPEQALAAILRWASALREVHRTKTGQRRMFALWSYFLEVTDVRPERFRRVVAEILDESAADTIMSTADKLRAQGRREGRVEGKAEGKTEGRAELLLRILTARFGPLSPPTTACVQSASPEDLDRWAVRVLDAKILDDVFDRE